jgi:preprotein translocase subunit SecG
MSVLYIILSIVCLLLCSATITLILLQKKRAAGWTASMAGMGAQVASYYDKNRKRTREGRLEKYTKICGVAFILCSLALTVKWVW